MNGAKFRHKTISCMEHIPGAQPINGFGIAKLPMLFQWFFRNKMSQTAPSCDISLLQITGGVMPSRWHSNCQVPFGEFCQAAEISERMTQSCTEQSWCSIEFRWLSKCCWILMWNMYAQWLWKSRELGKKFSAGFWGSYSHQLRIAKCRYKPTWQVAQDVKDNGVISVTTWFLSQLWDVLHVFTEHLQMPNQSRHYP